MRYEINPFPAVRVNWKCWRFTIRALDYHSKIKDLRGLIQKGEYSIEEILKALIEWNYRLEFIIKMPDSWTKKKKQELSGQPHRQTPDIDNIFKAFTDTIFYKQENYNDREIYKMIAYKYRASENEDWHINFYIT